MKYLDCVELIVEKEKYSKEGVHKGMQGVIWLEDRIDGKWDVCFPQYGEKENIPEISSLKIKVAKPAKTKLKEIKENIESVSLPTVKEKVEDVSQKSKKELFEEFKKEMLAKYSNVQPWQVYENLNSEEKKKWNALR